MAVLTGFNLEGTIAMLVIQVGRNLRVYAPCAAVYVQESWLPEASIDVSGPQINQTWKDSLRPLLKYAGATLF